MLEHTHPADENFEARDGLQVASLPRGFFHSQDMDVSKNRGTPKWMFVMENP